MTDPLHRAAAEATTKPSTLVWNTNGARRVLAASVVALGAACGPATPPEGSDDAGAPPAAWAP
jgi:hypothetical protein